MKANSVVKLYMYSEIKETILIVLLVILEVSLHLKKKIFFCKRKEFSETNRNSFRGQLNPLVMNVKEKNEFLSDSLCMTFFNK